MHAPYRWRKHWWYTAHCQSLFPIALDSSVCTGYISCLEVVDKFFGLCWFFSDDDLIYAIPSGKSANGRNANPSSILQKILKSWSSM
jgi:hypothetical protein